MRRLLRRDRAFHALVIVLLGIGIGSATLVFSIVNEVLLKPLPVRDPNNLYVLARTSPGELRLALSVAQRQRELGIRVAVGARVGEVVRAASGWLLRATRPVLYGVAAMDPASLAAAGMALVLCGVAAAIPSGEARRAGRSRCDFA